MLNVWGHFIIWLPDQHVCHRAHRFNFTFQHRWKQVGYYFPGKHLSNTSSSQRWSLLQSERQAWEESPIFLICLQWSDNLTPHTLQLSWSEELWPLQRHGSGLIHHSPPLNPAHILCWVGWSQFLSFSLELTFDSKIFNVCRPWALALIHRSPCTHFFC